MLVISIIAHFVVQPLAQLHQVPTRWAYTHQAAPRGKQALGFKPVKRAEHTGQKLAAGIGQWYAGHAGDQPGQLRVALAGPLDRLAGDIQRVAIGVGQCLGDLRSVVTLATADVEPALRRALGGQLGQAFGHRCVMTGVEKVAAGFNHGLVIARVAAVFVLYRQQVQVPLTGTVKAVSGGAYDAVVDRRERFGADRAGEHQASNLIRVW